MSPLLSVWVQLVVAVAGEASHGETDLWYWDGLAGRRRPRGNQLMVVDVVLAVGWPWVLVETQNAQSLLSPARPQVAYMSVPAHVYGKSRVAYHVVIASIQSRRIRHRPIHNPPLRLVFCSDKVLNFPARKTRQHDTQNLKSGFQSVTYASEGT